jgi:hypothetical protein
MMLSAIIMEHSMREVRNPWPGLCTVNGDRNGLMGVRTLIMAMQWGAPSSKLTPEARQLLEEYSRERQKQKGE